MVNINGKEFTIYELDTDASILSRIAVELDTIPKYLFFPGEKAKNLKEADDIIVKDILRMIKKNASKSMDFKDFLDKNANKFSGLDIKNDIFLVWLAYNTIIEELADVNPIILSQLGEKYSGNGYFENTEEFERFWKDNRAGIKRDLESLIQREKNDTKKYIELYNTFDNIEDGLAYTEFKTERVMLDMTLDLHDITLLEIFNHLLLNEAIPFASCKNYYKILKDYIPPEEWGVSSEDTLFLKMFEKQLVDTTKYKDYTEVRIRVMDKVKVSMKLITERGYLSRDQFIERFIGVFHGLGKIEYTELNENGVIGLFYFPQERLHTYVFSDLVMNNSIFSSLISIDESTKATKKKGDSTQPWLYIHFTHPSTGHITAAITQKFVDRSDPMMREEDPEIFPHNEPYIRVKVKGRDKQSVEFFQKMFSKLLVIYEEKYNEIVQFYEQFIPDFGVIEETSSPLRKKQTEMLSPDIFVKNYTRNCSEARVPEIVTKKQARELYKQGKQTMVFPRDAQENEPHYPSDGKNQQYYICPNPDYPYPGLQLNKLENNVEYPFVPCCFRTKQEGKKGGTWNRYFFNEKEEAKEKKQQELIITDKFLDPEKYGNLPLDLQKLFEIFDTDTNYKYIRVGVSKGMSSFLKAVMVGLYEQTGILNYNTEQEKDDKVMEIRKEISSENISPMARQSMYDMPIEKIMENIANDKTYFDPKFYLQLLEEYFNCNIFLFRRKDQEVRPVLPRYVQSYYKNHRISPCVFIYEHWGSESDHAIYPRCELIVKWNTKKSTDTQYTFPYDSQISRNVNKVFRLLNEAYSLNKKITEIVFPIPSFIKILSQTIDSYGKTRRIDIEHETKRISLLTSPIPPIAIKEEDNINITKINANMALELFKILGIKVESQSTSKGILKEINGILGNVVVSIPIIEEHPILDDIPISNTGIQYPEEQVSILETYNKNKKLARYITEYLFWIFSRYIQEQNILEITDKILAKFAKDKIVVKPGFQYKIVSKTFSIDSSLMDRGRLIVSSEDMLKRLMYVLKLYSIRDIKSLRTYYKRNVITHYYVDITDFDNLPGQVILQGDDAIDKWIQESKFIYTINNSIVIGQNFPYFFKNDLVKDELFLAQNSNTLEKALSIAVAWQKQGYNPGISDDFVIKKSYEFILYSYKSPENITEYKVTGNKKLEKDIRILGYKLSGVEFYTVLLSL